MAESRNDDRALGMGRAITRRDFLQGTGALVAGAAACSLPEEWPDSAQIPSAAGPYPPALTGLRGSDEPAYRVAHLLARSGQRDFGPVHDVDSKIYDLVVVGGGLSGLSAAYFFRAQKPDARILILENHDDFGGHARRNEFQINGQTLIGYGGSQSLEDPHEYPAATRKLIDELGVDLSRFNSAYDQNFYKRNGLRIGLHFDGQIYGRNHWVPYAFANPLDDEEFAPTELSPAEAIQQMPISSSARKELLGILEPSPKRFGRDPKTLDADFLRSLTYQDFVQRYLGATDPEIIRILNTAAVSNFSDSIDAISAWGALSWGGLPGLPEETVERLLTEEEWSFEPYIYHFPDGNASIARLLVRSLIPGVAPGQGMDNIVLAPFDYGRLDEDSSRIRLRLGSTVIQAQHEGPLDSAESLSVTYVRNGRAERIRARHCVMACYSVMIPYICPELPAPQQEALGSLVKAPLIYTNVLLRNWEPFAEKGIGWAFCPGLDHQVAALDFPVSLGDYQFSSRPDQPILVHLEGSPLEPGSGLTPREQYRAARARMLGTSFESLERSVRRQLSGLLEGTAFDPATDIQGLTVNRWGHGYAYGYNALRDPEDRPRPDRDRPHRVGRKQMGRVAIANSDAGASPSLPGAIEQAYRAINELL